MQFYENKTVPKLVIINSDIKDKKLIEETLSKKEGNTISINTAKKGTKAKVVAMAEKNAKESLNRKLYETNNNKNLFEGVAKKFNLKKSINLVEVYDNSHISGTNSVGAMVTFGNEGLLKRDIENLILKQKELNKMTLLCLKKFYLEGLKGQF
jgi:excinuclease ABC subunit C